MKRMLMMPGWGYKPSVFDPLAEALDDDLEFEHFDTMSACLQPEPLQALIAQSFSADVLVGWSLGGLLALQLALDHPDRVGALVLLATTPCFTERPGWDAGMPRNVFDGFVQQVKEDPLAGLDQFIRLNLGSRPDRDVRTVLKDKLDLDRPEALLAGLQVLEQMDLRGRVRELRVPTLILHASDDHLVPLAAGRWLADQVAVSRMKIFETGGHAFFLSHAGDVAGAIQDWL